MMISELTQALRKLDFRGLSESLEDFLSHATEKRLGPVQQLEKIVAIETEERNRRSLERRETRAQIGHFKPVCDFDWQWPTEINRTAVERSLRGQFIHEGANIVLAGPHGLGKTMLLKNLAHQAVLNGHTVLFVTAQKMLGDLSGIDSPTKLERRLQHYSRLHLLCIDEVGYLSYDSRAADLLFEVVNRRYQAKKSIAMTTNLAFKDWNTVFPNATCTVALVDRLCHRADIIKITGKSWRRKEAVERQDRLSQDEEVP
jgi:DNA replication protein DnaC